VVAIVGGLVFAGGASKISEAEKACPSRKDCLPSVTDHGNQGRRQEQTGGIVLGAGAALAAGGLVWYFVSGSPSRAADTAHGLAVGQAELSPSVSAGYAGIALAGSF
jgi:hypothetical protein